MSEADRGTAETTPRELESTWPAPELRERANSLGWLAVSAPSDTISIGVTGATRNEAMRIYHERRKFWDSIQTGAADS